MSLSESLETPTNQYNGPAWDNSGEFPSLTSVEMSTAVSRIENLISSISELTSKLATLLDKAPTLSLPEASPAIDTARKVSLLREEIGVLLRDVATYANCELSVNGANDVARKLQSQAQALAAKIDQAMKPYHLFLVLVPEEVVERYLDDPRTGAERYVVSHGRLQRSTLLPLDQETLISALEVNGFQAWSNLYNALAGKLMCTIDGLDASQGSQGPQTLGIAKAMNLLDSPVPVVRQKAWHAVNAAWETQEDTCASILNAMVGWRLEVNRKRSHTTAVGILDEALHLNRMQGSTLTAMLDAVRGAQKIARRAVKLRARALGKESLQPWDLFAPPPSWGAGNNKLFSYAEGLSLVESAFSSIHPDMGAFVRVMRDNRWIEGRSQDGKRPGAYCTSFQRSRSPRVYMTYGGSMGDIGTLAHELGHAFHTWVMRDLPLSQNGYPMNLAETASILAETIVKGKLLEASTDNASLFEVLWGDMESAAVFLLNIPARFEFERDLYTLRGNSTLSPNDLKNLMTASWQEWYGDSLAQMDPMFWASKLHFYIVRPPFYNFPYTFGYLFSLGVYAQRNRLGREFYAAYTELLRDTGRMPVEQLVKKHLDADIQNAEFWKQSISIVEQQVDAFERVLGELER